MRYCFASWVTTKGASPLVARKSSQLKVTWLLTVAPAAGLRSLMPLDFFWKALALSLAVLSVRAGAAARSRSTSMHGRTNQ